MTPFLRPFFIWNKFLCSLVCLLFWVQVILQWYISFCWTPTIQISHCFCHFCHFRHFCYFRHFNCPIWWVELVMSESRLLTMATKLHLATSLQQPQKCILPTSLFLWLKSQTYTTFTKLLLFTKFHKPHGADANS